MDTELIPILITNQAGGQVFYLPREEWARLEEDYSSYQRNEHPTSGSYRHCKPEAQPKAMPPARLWRKLLAGKTKTVRFDLEFSDTSIISGQ